MKKFITYMSKTEKQLSQKKNRILTRFTIT
nr:MAG TPA: hypothetical protein [Caudoviricetes sp.]